MTISWREQSSFGSETARKGRSRRREEAEPDLQSRIRLLTSAATNRGSAAPWLSPSGREFPKTNISRSESLNRGSAFSASGWLTSCFRSPLGLVFTQIFLAEYDWCVANEPFSRATLWQQLSLIDPVDATAIPTGLCPPAQGCEERATLGMGGRRIPTPTGLRLPRRAHRRNPVGVGALRWQVPQGSSFLATLGFGPESLWDSPRACGVRNGVQIKPGRLPASICLLELRAELCLNK